MELSVIFSVDYPIVGPLVLKPLPGSPLFRGALDDVIEKALGGADGISFENLGDAPHFKTTAPPGDGGFFRSRDRRSEEENAPTDWSQCPPKLR